MDIYIENEFTGLLSHAGKAESMQEAEEISVTLSATYDKDTYIFLDNFLQKKIMAGKSIVATKIA